MEAIKEISLVGIFSVLGREGGMGRNPKISLLDSILLLLAPSGALIAIQTYY